MLKKVVIKVAGLLSVLSARGVNVVAFPLGPEIVALAMSGSSALVAINALLLERIRLPGIKHI